MAGAHASVVTHPAGMETGRLQICGTAPAGNDRPHPVHETGQDFVIVPRGKDGPEARAADTRTTP